MGMFESYRARKAVSSILESPSPNTASVIQATNSLKKMGAGAIPYLVDALQDGIHVDLLESVLESLVSDKTLPYFVDALAVDDKAIVTAIKHILSISPRYDVNLLLDAFERVDVRKEHILEILKNQGARLNQKEVLERLYQGSSNVRQVLYQLLQQVGTEAMVPDLLIYMNSDSADTRFRATKLLSKFSNDTSRNALFKVLGDSNKNVRMAALEGLAQLDMPVPSQPICKMLGDPDMMVQSKAIETLIKLNDAATVKHLMEYLQDESEYVRRAAVEVLNEVGNTSAIKDLLMALRDQDWWVRVRAADALGTIGGPRVVDAVLALIKDKDPFLRRTAVEILNTSKDERAFGSLVEALQDEDWWVRERAADALASLGNPQAVKPLREMLGKDSQTTQVAIRALASLDDRSSVRSLMQLLNNNSTAVQKEALKALAKLVDENTATEVQEAVTRMIHVSDKEIRELASETANEMADRFAGKTQVLNRSQVDAMRDRIPSEPVPTPTPQPRTVIESDTFIDADKLRPDEMIGNRYRVIKRVGKGGFGTVILVDDEVVDDRFILKFLNPTLASDENVVQRFTHELRYARKVTHENIIRIYDFLTFGRSYAISMEYFASHSLAEEMDSDKPVDIRRMVKILRDLCSGMNMAQQAHVVHRDLKPANILINEKDVVKVVDFGLAAAASKMDSRITKTGVLVGTPTYMAPEQARGDNIDSRTDIYSLGVIMYRIFTGRPPYEDKDPMSTLLKHVEGKARPPRELNPDIPEELENIIRKAMQVRKEDRYQSFDELRRDLDALLQRLG